MSSITTTAVAPNSQHRIHACEFVTNQHCDPFFSLFLALGLMFTIFLPIAMVLLMLHDILITTAPPKLYVYAILSILFGFTQKPELTFFFLLPQKINIFFFFLLIISIFGSYNITGVSWFVHSLFGWFINILSISFHSAAYCHIQLWCSI